MAGGMGSLLITPLDTVELLDLGTYTEPMFLVVGNLEVLEICMLWDQAEARCPRVRSF